MCGQWLQVLISGSDLHYCYYNTNYNKCIGQVEYWPKSQINKVNNAAEIKPIQNI